MKVGNQILGDFVREVDDVDCATATDDDADRIRALLFDHRVLVIRDQRLTPEQYQRFMRRLGRPVPHVLQNLTVDGFPAILKISDYVRPDGTPFGVLDGGTYWHSDMSYLPVLGIATSLYAVRAAPDSGRTAFLDLARGWQVLSEDRELLALLGCATPEDATAIEVAHRFGNRRALTDRAAADQELSPAQRSAVPPTRHRLVERHPVTGRLGLFATSGSAMEIVGLDPDTSSLVLDRIERTLLAELAVHTHQYQVGDLVIWDNTHTLHRGTDVRATHAVEDSRLLHRINVDYAEEQQ